jgi:Domain of unknown function (DUF4397)
MTLLATKNCLSENNQMFRLSKALPLVLALATLGIFAAGCGNGGNAQVRVVNAIDASNNLPLDIDINGTKDFPSVGTGAVYPTIATPAAYVSVPSGNITIQAYDAGTTTNGIFGNGVTGSLSGSTQYTMLLGGFLSTSPNAYIIPDNNTVPTQGNLEIRIINGSALSAASNGISAAIYQAGQSVPSPQVTNLGLGQASSYEVLPFEQGQEYFIQVYLAGSQTPLFNYGFTPGGSSTAGSITTFVIIDNENGSAISGEPIYMQDLN